MPNKQDHIIRKGKLSDEKGVEALWRDLHEFHENDFPKDFSLSQDAGASMRAFFKTHVRSHQRLALVAEVDGKLVGYLMATIEDRPPVLTIKKQVHIYDLHVSEEHRSKGIGKAMMDEMEAWTKEKGVNYILLEVMSTNEGGKKFYKREGYETLLHAVRKIL